MPAPTLANLALRLDALLDEVPSLVHVLRFLVGALVALKRADGLGFENADHQRRDWLLHLSEMRQVTSALRDNAKLPSRWEAGFSYNNAVVRVDASHERLLLAILGAETSAKRKGSTTDTLARAIFDTWGIELGPRGHLEALRQQVVNALKHDEDGYPRTDSDPRSTEGILLAIDELLSLVEAFGVREHLLARRTECGSQFVRAPHSTGEKERAQPGLTTTDDNNGDDL